MTDLVALAERLEKIAEDLANLDLVDDDTEVIAKARWQAVAAQRDAAAALRQFAWRPIEEAPRDGTHVLLAWRRDIERWNGAIRKK